MSAFEKSGVFYLGKTVDPKTGKTEDDYTLYNAKDLTTHAVCVGMTGSGKTGLGIDILEEAAIDKIPAIIIDPKGDLTNLLLTFPTLSADEFKPWVDSSEAERKNMSVEQYAQHTAKSWKEGLAAWDQPAERIRTLKSAVDMRIYTPASTMGVPLSILDSFAAPSEDEQKDSGAIRDKIQSLTASLLGLLGINADPLKSREQILIATLIDQAWKNGQDVDIASLIQQVQKPPFKKIGALDIDTFYPPKERMELSITLNNLLASPSFQAWMQGDSLDIQRLLYTLEGKPTLSIISIAHLSDSERMFFVTLLLNQFITWMRQQPGTSSLRALLYMDEIFGYFPPTAMPPSKLPMLTLLKQARAYGVGIILVTQNPVDLDYKGLANCGTWFIGKLQTDRDKMRVIEGLQIASNGDIDAQTLDSMIAMTGNRTFIMRSIYKKEPILFQTRWTLSYLKGPLTLRQIAILTEHPEKQAQKSPERLKPQIASKPSIPPGITEYFAHPSAEKQSLEYLPKLLGKAKLHYVDTKNKIDIWDTVLLAAEAADVDNTVNWDDAQNITDHGDKLKSTAAPNSTFEEIPLSLLQEKNYALFAKSLSLWLYQKQMLTIYKSPDVNLLSTPKETEGDFRARASLAMREKRDELIKQLQDSYAKKIDAITEKMKKAENTLEERKHNSLINKVQTWISLGATVIGALLGRGRITQTTITQTGSSLKRASKLSKDSQNTQRAQETYEELKQQLQDISLQMAAETAKISVDPQNIPIETITIAPRKSDISIEKMALIWWPKSF